MAACRAEADVQAALARGRGARAAPLDRRARDGPGRRRRRATRGRWPLALPLPGDATRAELSRRVVEAVGRGARASTGSTSTSATWTTTSCGPSAAVLKGVAPPNPLAGRSTPPRRREPPEPRVNPFTDTRTRVLAIASGKGGVGKSSVTTNLVDRARRSAGTGSPRSTPTCGASRCRGCSASTRPPGLIDDVIVPPEAQRRAAHLDGLLRPRGPGRHLARPDAAQGARAVPHRRLLGRARLPRRRHAARHRRRLAVDRAVPPARRGDRRHHAAARRAAGRAARGGDGARRSTSR